MWRDLWAKPLGWLTVIGDRHVPRLIVITMGVVGAAAGMFFLLIPAEFLMGTWAFLLHGAPAIFWGIVFLAAGSGLATAGVIDHTKSTFLCFAEAMVFFGLAVASLTDGKTFGTRFVFGVCTAFGWVCIIAMIASIAAAEKETPGART